ncbi:unnamed protein product [Linum tenue]|uniref:Uncharacterized protein n=1 Tax=Linum tenue TaxID=586396 RepID=A0AAV0RSV5_9ROSI|nr:unnamed protein product [Linum tenue]
MEDQVVVMEEEEEVVVMEEEDRGVVMEDKGTVRENNMFGRVYSRKRSKQNVLPVVQELEVPAVTSTVDEVVEAMESEVMDMHYTDPQTTFVDVMQIGFQATAAADASIRTSPTTIHVEATDATKVLTQGGDRVYAFYHTRIMEGNSKNSCIREVKTSPNRLISPNARVAKEDHAPVGKVIFEYVTKFLKDQRVDCKLDAEICFGIFKMEL